ncbi:MAG: class I SAM-dependent methyltransferase [Nigerium sp.]|nr:class I SAM-dependent methyltransferase [Nigerium sp.]
MHHAHRHGHAHHADGPVISFDERARAWDTPERHRRARVVAEAIAANIPLDGAWDAVEIGCGTGLLSLQVGPRLRHVLLTDVSRGMLDVAREHAVHDPERYTVAEHDLTSAPLAQPVDLAFTAMALHHIADLTALLTHVRAGLNPGGWVAVVDIDADPDNTFHPDGFAGHHGIDRDALTSHLRELGFADVTARTIDTLVRVKNGQEFEHDVFLATGHLPA